MNGRKKSEGAWMQISNVPTTSRKSQGRWSGKANKKRKESIECISQPFSTKC